MKNREGVVETGSTLSGGALSRTMWTASLHNHTVAAGSEHDHMAFGREADRLARLRRSSWTSDGRRRDSNPWSLR